MQWIGLIPKLCAYLALAIAAVAAVTDARTGHIPNWLTLPPLIVAPVLWGLYGGWIGDLRASAVGSLVSMFLVALVPALLGGFVTLETTDGEKVNAGGMGDAKLFAALGALLLWGVGIEALFYSLVSQSVIAMGWMAWNGKLWSLLGNTASLLLNPFLPERKKRSVRAELLTRMRFGPAVFVGTLVALLTNNLQLVWL